MREAGEYGGDDFIPRRQNSHARLSPLRDVVDPNAARTPVSRLVSVVPARKTVLRWRVGSGERDSQTRESLPAAHSKCPPIVSACSIITMASAPRCSIPPVAIAIASPEVNSPCGAVPAWRISSHHLQCARSDFRSRRKCPLRGRRSHRNSSDQTPAR